MRHKKVIATVFLIFVLFCSLCGCSKAHVFSKTEYTGIDDLAGKKIGVTTGSFFDQLAEERIQDPNIQYYNSIVDCALALQQGKIDAYIADEPMARIMINEHPEQHVLSYLGNDDYGFIFPKTDKGAALRDEFNEFLAKCYEDGTIEEIDRIWFGDDKSVQVLDTSTLTGENGILKLAADSTNMPFGYIKDGKMVGYEIDLAVRFCREYGYGIEISDTTFTGLLASVTVGKSDFGVTCISITEERKESLHFSEPDYHGGIAVVANTEKSEKAEGAGGILTSFKKTFVLENRWKLFTDGIGVTIFITLFSTIFGTLIGFLLYLVYRKGYRIFNSILNALKAFTEKTPIIVILMILYYILFGSSGVNGKWISVIGFSIIFACGFVGTLEVGVGAIDKGQNEASLALGFSDTKTFLFVILPQAARHFMPNYRGSIVSLLKDTAIVGYIAVQDLTKVCDIVRSRTYEAFFPLIATAVVYFLLAFLLTQFVKCFEFSIDPKTRSTEKILKGVKTR